MPIKTIAEQLEEVQNAITAVMDGQSYSFKGRSLTLADLNTLQAREKYLRAEYNRENANHSPIVGSFDHR